MLCQLECGKVTPTQLWKLWHKRPHSYSWVPGKFPLSWNLGATLSNLCHRETASQTKSSLLAPQPRQHTKLLDHSAPRNSSLYRCASLSIQCLDTIVHGQNSQIMGTLGGCPQHRGKGEALGSSNHRHNTHGTASFIPGTGSL